MSSVFQWTQCRPLDNSGIGGRSNVIWNENWIQWMLAPAAKSSMRCRREYTLKSAAGHVALYAPAQHHDRPNVNWFSWHFQTEDWLHFVKWIISAAASMEAMLRFHVFFFDGFCWKKSHMSSVVTNVWLVFEEDLCSSKVKSRSGQVSDVFLFLCGLLQ